MKIIVFALIFLSAAASAQAEPYVGIEGGYLLEQFSTPKTLDYDNALSFGLFAGSRFTELFAAEFSFRRNLGDIDVDIPGGSGATVIYTYMVGAKIFSPVYLRADVGLMDAQSRHLRAAPDGTGACFGLGAGYEHSLTESVGLGFESSYIFGVDGVSEFKFFLFSVRLSFSFL